MRNELENIELIENYLMGHLSNDAQSIFESKLASDSKLKKEVDFQRDLMEGMERLGLKSDTQTAYLKFKLQKLLYRLGIVIGVVGIIAASYFWIQQNQESELVYCPCAEDGTKYSGEMHQDQQQQFRQCFDTCLISNAKLDNEAKLFIGDTIDFSKIETFDSLVQPIESEITDDMHTEEVSSNRRQMTNHEAPETILEDERVMQEVEPTFPGGYSAMSAFMDENIRYPQLAIQKRASGIVYVRFVVNEKGEIINPTIEKGVSKELNAEAIRVVKKMPNWTPAVFHGEATASYFTLPIQFSLDFNE